MQVAAVEIGLNGLALSLEAKTAFALLASRDTVVSDELPAVEQERAISSRIGRQVPAYRVRRQRGRTQPYPYEREGWGYF